MKSLFSHGDTTPIKLPERFLPARATVLRASTQPPATLTLGPLGLPAPPGVWGIPGTCTPAWVPLPPIPRPNAGRFRGS